MSVSKEILVTASSTLHKRLSREPRTIDLQLTRSDSVPLLSPGVISEPNIVDDKKRQRTSVESLLASKFSSKVNHSSNARILSRHSVAPAAPTYKPRPHISAHSNKAASFLPIIVPRHSSEVDAGPIIAEDTAGDLSVEEPQNIIKGDLAVNHDNKDGKLLKMIDSRSSNDDVEVGCRRITDDVEYDKVFPKTSLRVNVGFDFRIRAPENQNMHERIFQSKPISAERNNIRATSSHGENNLSRLVCSESIDSNEIGSWYDSSGFEKRNYADEGNPDFANINRSAVIRLSKLTESSGRHAVELRKCFRL
jgi:katanin p80 WD40 repeat-containing subunit B1